MRVRSSWIAASVAALFGAAAAVSAGDVDRTIGTLPPGKTITIKFRVTTSGTAATVSNQGTVNGTNFTSVLTDDPKVAGTADATLTAIQLSPTIGITASANPAAFGQTVVLTATVSGTGATPTGTVQFKDGGTDIGSAQTLSSGQATLSGTYAVGNHTITVAYVGDTNYNAGTGSLTGNPLVVGLSNTTTTVTGPGAATVTGQSATFTATVAAVAPGTGTPTGTVTFTEGATTHCSAVAVNGSGQATCAIAFTSATAHTITAAYSGSSNYNTSTGNASAHTVNTAATSTAVTSSANPSAFGQTVTFTAAVTATSPGAGTPTGNVVFTIDGTPQAPIALVSGSASTSTAALAVGSHTVTVAYAGDSNFATSNGTLAGGQAVNQASTTVGLTSSINPSVFGQSVTLTATVGPVAPGTGIPTGTVTFKNGATTLGSGTLNGSGVATLNTSALAVGSHSLTADYSGDGSFSAATGTLTGTPQVVNKASTTSAVVSSVNPSVFGQAVTFTATVTAVSPGAGVPTGTVTFLDGATTLGTGTLNGSGQATFTTSGLAFGGRSITAAYAGDTSFTTSTSSPLTQTVNRASTSVALGSSVNPSVFGQPVTFTATVASVAPGSGTPTGTITFRDSGTAIGTGALSGGGVATITISTLAVGSHSITADYGGDTNFATSSASPSSQVVNKASTSSTLASSLNPSSFAQTVTITATVAAVSPGGGTPTGTVTFRDGGTALGAAVALVSGQATFTSSTLSVGAHSLTADYSGDTSFLASSAATFTQTVNKATPGLSIASSLNPSTTGTAVMFTATMTSAAGTPTGTVTFQDGASTMATVTLSSGTATFSTTSLGFGSHLITAAYSGDALNASRTATLTQVVNSPDNPTLYVLDASVIESHTGNSLLKFTLRLSAPTTLPASVDFATLDNTAVGGGDFVHTNGTVTIPAGETVRTFVVSVFGDTLVEPDETLTVSLSNAQNALLAANQATGTIINDDPPVAAGSVLMYRLYNPFSQDHLFTTDANENAVLGTIGWAQEGVAFTMFQFAGTFGGGLTIPVHRLYHAGFAQHLWTTDWFEAYSLSRVPGWAYEGIDGHVMPNSVPGTRPVFRLSLPGTPLHLYTVDANEHAVLQTRGWLSEGIFGYVLQ
jgi:hypothetical protein